MQKNNIILIGFMASGKTTVAKAISKKLNMPFTDTDVLIENTEGKKIKDIFRLKGEKYFRETETNILKKLSFLDNVIISTGGGIILSKENRSLLRKIGKVFYLKASVKQISSRLNKESKNKRPLLVRIKDKKGIIEELVNAREGFYGSCAHYIIDTSDLTVRGVADKIIKIMGQK